MGTKQNPGAYDCHQAAEPDEPLFTLLGRDKHAPTLIWLWATLRELDGEDPAKVDEARSCAVEMMAWASAHGRPVVGLGQATMAGMIELIRTVNHHVKDAENQPTDSDIVVLRRFLCATEFEGLPTEPPASQG